MKEAATPNNRRQHTSPTKRTLQWLKGRGVIGAVVEPWNPHARIRQDLFGFIDLLYVAGMEGIVGVQATDGGGISRRIAKATSFEQEPPKPRADGKPGRPVPPCGPRLHAWLAAGGKFCVIGWRQVGARGERKLWKPRVVWVRLRDGEFVSVEEESGLFAQDAVA